MKRFHISISTADYDASVADYSNRLGQAPDVEIKGRYARWRTELLNFTVSCKPGQPGGTVRHIGFEDDGEVAFREVLDVNDIVWEYFSQSVQEQEVKEKFGDGL